MTQKTSMNKIALSILVSIILTVILVSLTNVGLSLFLEEPDYNDFCGEFKTQEVIATQERCEEIGGKWNPEGKSYPRPVNDNIDMVNGYCDKRISCE